MYKTVQQYTYKSYESSDDMITIVESSTITDDDIDDIFN